MRKRASKFEIIIDRLIPYALVLIIAITVVEIFFRATASKYSLIIDLFDLGILWLFAMDLLYKYEHATSIRSFLRHYWIYILAVFPFFLVFRVIERFYQISTISPSSTIILGRYLANLFEESRLVKLLETFKFLSISSRLLRAVYFYEDPKIRHKINAKRLLRLKTKKR